MIIVKTAPLLNLISLILNYKCIEYCTKTRENRCSFIVTKWSLDDVNCTGMKRNKLTANQRNVGHVRKISSFLRRHIYRIYWDMTCCAVFQLKGGFSLTVSIEHMPNWERV